MLPIDGSPIVASLFTLLPSQTKHYALQRPKPIACLNASLHNPTPLGHLCHLRLRSAPCRRYNIQMCHTPTDARRMEVIGAGCSSTGKNTQHPRSPERRVLKWSRGMMDIGGLGSSICWNASAQSCKISMDSRSPRVPAHLCTPPASNVRSMACA